MNQVRGKIPKANKAMCTLSVKIWLTSHAYVALCFTQDNGTNKSLQTAQQLNRVFIRFSISLLVWQGKSESAKYYLGSNHGENAPDD